MLTSIEGKAQKGPFVNGSTVVVYELDEQLNPTGRSFNSKIISQQGSFFIDSVSLASSFAQVEVEGLYFSELDGNVSFREINISSLVKLEDGVSSNVNLLTQIENTRIKNLIKEGLSFDEAKKKSLEELREVFSYPYEVHNTSEGLDLFDEGTDGIFLFCASAVILATNDDYDATVHASWLNYLIELEADFGDNGRIDSPGLMERLKLGAFHTLQNADDIREGFKRTIEITGASIDVPYFEPIVAGLFDENDGPSDSEFFNAIDFFPSPVSSLPNIMSLTDGTLLTDQELVLAIEVPNDKENYSFSFDLTAGSENKQGTLSLESPAWSSFEVYEDVRYWSVSGRIDLPSNNLLGTIEIPFTFNGMGWVHLRGILDSDGESDEFTKTFLWNTDPLLPAVIDTVVIRGSEPGDIGYHVNSLGQASYLIFEDIETLRSVSFSHAYNLVGVEFPSLKKITNELSINFNPVLQSFIAPKLEVNNGYFTFQNNPMIETFSVPNLNTISDYVLIRRNNKLEVFNLGGLHFGDDLSQIIKGQYEVCWVYQDKVYCDGTY